MSKIEYGNALDAVKKAISYDSEADLCMVKSFAEVNDADNAIEIVAEMYQQAHEGVRDFNMSVHDYVLAILDQENKIKHGSYFENEVEAEQVGFFWVDEICYWVKLQF